MTQPTTTTSTTTTSTITTKLDWTKPGPGTWQLDESHFEPDCSRISQRAIESGVAKGMAKGFSKMGSPLAGLEARFVNGNFYLRMIPLVGAGRDLPPPPAALLWLVTRLHPTFRNEAKKAKHSLESRAWNNELRDWEQIHKPYLIDQCSRHADVQPKELDDEQLAGHIEELVELVNHGTALHFELHVSDLGPIGLLLRSARDWGLDQVAVMATLTGASPATSSPIVALAEISKATEGHGPFETLDEIRAVSPESARLLDKFLATYGWRLTTGYDLQATTLAEIPELVITAINSPRDDGNIINLAADAKAQGDSAYEELRQQLDPTDQPRFKELVDDARALYGLRDENGPLTYQWPAGLLRRAILEAGQRLAERGSVTDQRQTFQLEAEELVALLRGQSGPGLNELERRVAQSQEWKRHKAPAFLGTEQPPPPLWALPKSLATIMDVVLTVLDMIENQDTIPTLDGTGIGNEAYVGRARVVTDEVDALAKMEPGDVLIAPFTVPTYNAVLASAGAVVVENGGLLCHAAVIAREFGIAGLVGVTGVTDQITDGSLVRVDPVSGSIRELDEQSVL